MVNADLSAQLDLVERQFNEVSVVLLETDPQRLEAASARLYGLAVRLADLAQGVRNDAVAAKRLQTLAGGLTLLRSQLLRRRAYVDLDLNVVVPTDGVATYAGAAAGRYGSLARQTGAFKVLAA